MSKYKVGDKVVLTVTSTNEMGCLPCYVLNDDLILSKQDIDKYAEPLSAYTEPLEAKIRRQAEEITRHRAENKELKEDKAVLNAKIDAYELYGDQHEEEYNQAFNQGAEAAWELIRKIGNIQHYADEKIFGIDFILDLVREYTYQEAAAKVAEWEKAKEEIKVGDVLEDMASSKIKCVVTNIYPSNMAYLVFSDGSAGIHELENMKKTGRHIDIDSFLKQIGEE